MGRGENALNALREKSWSGSATRSGDRQELMPRVDAKSSCQEAVHCEAT